ncbi:MAG: PstS family phosphate ABC transporter substrate-binding protein [Acidobacteria bacterium]|nr:PstS family phosphate ABC transporter substrate-binding protein [Acidobacteriota bacterium]
MFTKRLLGVCVGVAVTAAACGGGAPDGADGARTPALVTIDGSSTVFPIAEAVAEEFQKVDPSVRITVGISGTGGGFQKFCRGETDISDASRPIRPTEIQACAAAGIEYIELPVAYDGLAVVVHPSNTWATSITVDELKRLWEPAAQGRITRWNQVRSDWPDQEIHLFGAGVDSGTYDYFTEATVGEEGASRGDFTSSEDDNVLVQGIGGDALALGFMPLAYFEQNRDSLRLVPVDDGNDDNGAGPIGPSADTVRTGTYQPLSRPLFVYVSRQAADRPEVAQLVGSFFEAEALVREVGYIELTPAIYALAQSHFAERRTGTAFGEGGSQVGVTLEQLLTREQ